MSKRFKLLGVRYCQDLQGFVKAETQSWILGGVRLHYAGDA